MTPCDTERVPRTREQLAAAADQAQAWVDSVDPAAIALPGTDAADLRDLAIATQAVADSRASQARAVEAARRNGKTWTQIAAILGISRQAAQKQFD